MSTINEAKKKAKEIVAYHAYKIKDVQGDDILIMSPYNAEFEIAILLKKIAKLENKLNDK